MISLIQSTQRSWCFYLWTTPWIWTVSSVLSTTTLVQAHWTPSLCVLLPGSAPSGLMQMSPPLRSLPCQHAQVRGSTSIHSVMHHPIYFFHLTYAILSWKSSLFKLFTASPPDKKISSRQTKTLWVLPTCVPQRPSTVPATNERLQVC